MTIRPEDIRNRVYLRMGMYGLKDKSSDSLLDTYIEGVATELADLDLDCLVRTGYYTTDETGTFIVPGGGIIPYIALCNGIKDQPHTWQRLTPVDYMYFANWNNRISRGSRGGGMGNLHNRYCVIPNPGSDEGTRLQVLEIKKSIPIMLMYYPITPHLSDYPDFAADLITNMVLERYIIDKQDAIKDRSIKLLMDQTKKLLKVFENQSGTIETTYYDQTTRNNKTRNWLYSETNDFGFWKR
jgi:hypothetical protein